ncbi:MAG: hypothetical protein A3B34_00890 [Candidatus Sungbacteria bacterium RIFCSPLOWO2_01_FULL_54_21]|uniref:DUF4878 domain-containing protein n=2 Tax=Candidatus Sungiibacteriota TaxID=1817917 RepID=A0A1G2L8J6_9BACT|nr:MAG: hypothetical protein A2679_03455 [Candidatus Sungbacteria bacterium RIFCSPHIGHO2_01_FULL_54_26]OHA03999.1 MAG: hypothetical protein A3C92_03580 [Candidatus Sungbacteria bacterium RIFCSPHIGHO2_02_FULL_53_17]OHA07976.1 MAG: hypothetical protein A3B34_00890 [Candidatus Sungbacteria bacterium RIFCSPLOWO2_01_FULL_54_21]
MTKNVFKFLGGAVAIVAIGMGALFAIDYIRYQKSPEYQAEKQAEEIKKEYREDPYGGDTPEETLKLFIEALKKGDIDLAAKYFVLDKQEEWRADLSQIQEKGLLDEMVGDLTSTKMTLKGEVAYFTLTRVNDLPSELVMHKNSLNNKWKITEL